MDMTPNDMKNHEFGTQMRGYEKAEVEAFVEKAAASLEEALNQIQVLKNQNDKISAQYQQLKDLEETIKSAVMEAQKNANQIIANAKKEAELMVSQAKQDRDKIFGEKKNEIRTIEEKIEKLEYQKEAFYNKLRSEIQAHMKLVDSINPPNAKMKSEEVKPNHDESFDEPDEPNDETHIEEPKMTEEAKPVEALKPKPAPPTPSMPPARPALDMKDDEIDAALDNLSIGEEKKNEEPEPVGVEANSGESESKKGVQDGHDNQSKGYDF